MSVLRRGDDLLLARHVWQDHIRRRTQTASREHCELLSDGSRETFSDPSVCLPTSYQVEDAQRQVEEAQKQLEAYQQVLPIRRLLLDSVSSSCLPLVQAAVPCLVSATGHRRPLLMEMECRLSLLYLISVCPQGYHFKCRLVT